MTIRAKTMLHILCAAAVGVMLFPHKAAAEDFDARARAIVAQMTLEEKVSQMHGTSTNKLHRVVVGVPRLGIPDLLVTNGPAGFGPAGPGHSSKATALPAPISLAATFDLEAAKQYGIIAGGESADLGNTLIEGPDVNLARIPGNGRTFEAYGEDPYLVGRIATACVVGIQSQGIIANVKHYAANNQEDRRDTVDAQIDERTLREIYLPAYEAAVKEGHVGSLMGAYNRVNGQYCCENDVLLNQILKKDWGFDGFLTSDFGAVHSTADTVNNGLDVEMPNGRYLGDPLKAALEAGTIPIAVIDEHLVRRFRTMMRLGVWEVHDHKPIPQEQDGAIAREIAGKGCVLLRNEGGLLPLDAKSLKSVALIGPMAAKAMTGGGGSSYVSPLYQVPPLDGLQKRLGPGVQVTMLDGKDIAAAVAAAKTADVAIVMVGDHQTEGRDHSIELGGDQDALVEAICAANKRTVVVLKTGGPILMPWVKNAPAILEAWYPGEEDGNVVAAVLLGDVNPSGKLPITFPKSLEDTPAHTPEQYPGVGPKGKEIEKYSEGVLVGYRWYNAKKLEPLFPFGYGLSYTTFTFQNLKLSSETLAGTSPTLTVEFDLTNTGSRDGAEVAQVYVGMPSQPGIVQPPRQLKGFARVNVVSGKTEHVRIELDARAFSYWDVSTHGWKIAPGDYAIEIGGSSRDIQLTRQVQAQ